MKKLLLNICLSVLSFLPLYAQDAAPLFSSNSYETRYYSAIRLNNSGQYVAAYDAFKALHDDMLLAIKEKNYKPSLLPSEADFKLYLNVVSSQAECAYKLNLWREITPLFDEHVSAYNDRFDHGLINSADFSSQIANFYKICGDYYYIRGIQSPEAYAYAQRDYETAIKYYDAAHDTQAKVKVYLDLAQLKYAQCLYDEALEQTEEALAINTTRRGAGSNAEESFNDETNEDLDIKLKSVYAMCLARTYSAENPMNFRKALNTINGLISQLPKKDKHISELQRMKAKILLLQHEQTGADIQDAASLYELHFKAVKDEVSTDFLQMTADQREEYWMLQRPFVVDCYLLEDRNAELLYDVTLYNKGMLLQTARSFENLLKPGENTKLLQLKQQDAQNALEGKTTALADDYEKALLQAITADGRRKKFFAPLNHTWKNVQKALPADGCAIEFVEYEKCDSMHFGALVLRKFGKPQFVHVCNAEELADYCPGSWWLSLKSLLKTTDGNYKNDIYEDDVIGNTIWSADLVSAIGSSKKVYFSADGYLHQLAIEYLLPERLQGKSFYRLSSTRVLADGNKIDAKKIRSGAAFVLGGIVYDSWTDDDDYHDSGNDADAYNLLQEKGTSFSYMKGAKLECDSIVYYRNNPNDLYLDNLNATEQAFYAHCGEYPILHLSTHGCFSGDKSVYNELLASSTKDVLSESVMALSNAGTHLRNKRFDAFNKDGLLSAREIARLNLENLELVTTSACQTGLGYITADGIYGMERGFKSAGVKGMVVSLWSVNVESARIFFTSLYKYIGEGESVHSAFNHARNDLLTKQFPVSSTTSKFNGATMSRKPETIIETKSYSAPQHSCPYILIDVF
ncbi:MAG: CHAT domain-containing protein [Bacteroidaceae bacterium]|nr:CHAT domain-containing protein [Bacteroidaceae bacterium]